MKIILKKEDLKKIMWYGMVDLSAEHMIFYNKKTNELIKSNCFILEEEERINIINNKNNILLKIFTYEYNDYYDESDEDSNREFKNSVNAFINSQIDEMKLNEQFEITD